MTLQFDANFVPSTYAEAIFRLKQRLKASGWIVQSSSDGTTFSTTPGNAFDQITTPVAGAGGMANDLAWFVIKHPTSYAQFCFQRSDVLPVNFWGPGEFGVTKNIAWRIKYSLLAPGFVGGAPSATQVPSSTDEKILVGDGTDAAPVFARQPLYPDGKQTFSICADDAPPHGWWAGGYGFDLDGWFMASTNENFNPYNISSSNQPDTLKHSPSGNFTTRSVFAHDIARGNTVCFNGTNAEVWIWDGDRWYHSGAIFWERIPFGRYETAMAYDQIRERTILFGGSTINGPGDLNDTWSWDGTAWTKLNPATVPPLRMGHSMVWSPALGKIVMFGGLDATYTGLNDTWAWDGTDWALLHSGVGTAPSVRHEFAMAIDPVNGRVLVHGGYNYAGGVALSDTWQFNTAANTWANVSSGAITVRCRHAMELDPISGMVILHGGDPTPTAGNTFLGDTWKWNGTTWTLFIASPTYPAVPPTYRAPGKRAFHSMVYDSTHSKLLLYGGAAYGDIAPGGVFAEPTDHNTWLWDGTQWDITRSAPFAQVGSRMVYDATRDRIVHFGGYNDSNAASDRTWEWNGTKWIRMWPATSPPPRHGHYLAFDSVNNVVVLFGGRNGAGVALGDTWVYNGITWTQKFPGTTPVPRYDGAMAYMPPISKVVLFGGYDSGGAKQNTTWAYDVVANTWTNMAPATNPEIRAGHEMAYMPPIGKLVMFGDGTFEQAITWFFTGTDWVLSGAASDPHPRIYHAMVYDAALSVIVAVGGYEIFGGPILNFYGRAFDGTDWIVLPEYFTQKSPPFPYNNTSAYGYMAGAYHASTQRVVVHASSTTWYTGRFNGSASGFMIYDPIKNPSLSDPDPFVVVVTQHSVPANVNETGLVALFAYYPNYTAWSTRFIGGLPVVAENERWGSLQLAWMLGGVGNQVHPGGLNLDPNFRGDHVKLHPAIWHTSSPVTVKGESSLILLPDHTYGYGGTALSVAAPGARDWMAHKICFTASPMGSYDDDHRKSIALPWNGSLQVFSADKNGPFSGNTEAYSIASPAWNNLVTPVEEVRSSIIASLPQAEIEIDPLLIAQEPLLPLGGGASLVYRMRGFDATLARVVFWNSPVIDSLGGDYAGPGPLSDIVVQEILGSC